MVATTSVRGNDPKLLAPWEEGTCQTSLPGLDRFLKMGVSKNVGTFLGVPIIRIIVYWGLYWGPLILGNYQIGLGAV